MSLDLFQLAIHEAAHAIYLESLGKRSYSYEIEETTRKDGSVGWSGRVVEGGREIATEAKAKVAMAGAIAETLFLLTDETETELKNAKLTDSQLDELVRIFFDRNGSTGQFPYKNGTLPIYSGNWENDQKLAWQCADGEAAFRKVATTIAERWAEVIHTANSIVKKCQEKENSTIRTWSFYRV